MKIFNSLNSMIKYFNYINNNFHETEEDLAALLLDFKKYHNEITKHENSILIIKMVFGIFLIVSNNYHNPIFFYDVCTLTIKFIETIFPNFENKNRLINVMIRAFGENIQLRKNLPLSTKEVKNYEFREELSKVIKYSQYYNYIGKNSTQNTQFFQYIKNTILVVAEDINQFCDDVLDVKNKNKLVSKVEFLRDILIWCYNYEIAISHIFKNSQVSRLIGDFCICCHNFENLDYSTSIESMFAKNLLYNIYSPNEFLFFWNGNKDKFKVLKTSIFSEIFNIIQKANPLNEWIFGPDVKNISINYINLANCVDFGKIIKIDYVPALIALLDFYKSMLIFNPNTYETFATYILEILLVIGFINEPLNTNELKKLLSSIPSYLLVDKIKLPFNSPEMVHGNKINNLLCDIKSDILIKTFVTKILF